MGKTYIDTVKYLVYANVKISGLVDKPDIVGAIFGQTEGLLGDELDLRDLQKNGRIGRIEVDKNPSAPRGTTVAVIKVPSSLDMVETCIIASALEAVDRVGPCEANIHVEKIEDTRNIKRRKLVDRAKALLKSLLKSEIPESREITENVREEVKKEEVITYGADKLPAGPNISRAKEIVVVEGRADVLNLLKNDIGNVIGMQGARVLPTIIEISKQKEVTLFLDGDRGGDLIMRSLAQAGAEIDFVARAPRGKEVEELTRKEIIKCLRNRLPFEQDFVNGNKDSIKESNRGSKRDYSNRSQNDRYQPRERTRPSRPIVKPSTEVKRPKVVVESAKQAGSKTTKPVEKKPKRKVKKEDLVKELEDLKDTLKARLYNSEFEMVDEIRVRDVIKALTNTKDTAAIVFDGIITQRLVDLASQRGVKTIIGSKIGNVNKKPEGLEISTKDKRIA